MMTTTRELRSQIKDVTKRDLTSLGFVKRAGKIFTLPVVDGVLGILSLNDGVHRSQDVVVIGINPMVSVRHHAVEQGLAEVLGQKAHPYLGVAFGEPVTYLLPGGRWKPWYFGLEEDVATTSRRMADAIRDYGIPFLGRYVSLETAIDGIRQYGLKPGSYYRLPIASRLLGDETAAREVLREGLAARAERTDAEAWQFRAFAYRMLGDEGAARVTVDQGVAAMGDRSDPIARTVRAWAAAFRDPRGIRT